MQNLLNKSCKFGESLLVGLCAGIISHFSMDLLHFGQFLLHVFRNLAVTGRAHLELEGKQISADS